MLATPLRADGRCALIHKHRPELLDFYKLDPEDRRGNTEKAFAVAEQFLDIPVSRRQTPQHTMES
jgi:hypothetical protein